MMQRVLGNISCDLDAKVKGQKVYLLVIASLPKPKQHHTLQVQRSYDLEGTGQYFKK